MRNFYKIFKPKTYVWLFNIYKNHGFEALRRRLQILILGYNRFYNKWLNIKNPNLEELNFQKKYKFDYEPLISIVVPTYNTPKSFFKEMVKSVQEQTYSKWELCIADGSTNNDVKAIVKEINDSKIKYVSLNKNKGISENTNSAIYIANGEYISFLDHDDVIEKHALFEIVQSLQSKHHDLIYTDEDFATKDLSFFHDPVFKPNWSPDLLLSHNYITHFVCVKKQIVDKIHGLNSLYDGAQDYDFLFRCIENSKSIYHIPKVLYHWRENDASVASDSSNKNYAYEAGLRALQDHIDRADICGYAESLSYPGFYTIRYNTPDNPLVSIIIPNMDHVKDIDKCLKSLYEVNSYKNFEIIIVENNSKDKDTFQYYSKIKDLYDNLNIVEYKGDFNFSKICNFGASVSNGEYLLFLNNDTEMIDSGSLCQMLGNCMRDDVGIVGAKLLYADDTIQHAGVVLGFGGFAGHVFTGKKKDSRGYMLRPLINCNYSAVTGACLLIKKDVFNEVHGFTEKFAVGLNDIDLCLKVRHLNKLVVYNANSLWHHYESKSRGYEDTPEKKARLNKEIKLFQSIWKEDLDKGDPYYSSNFSIDYLPYEMLKV
ncbi:MAG: glycosyltransferase family 2 protein [Coriobacteriia bacterium]|nr:glycosyltransferase family 2 protein [Coriobacteriia bacterium]